MEEEIQLTEEIILGEVSAYALAVKYGYKGTEEEWVRAQQKFHDESATSASEAANMATSASVAAYESKESADMSRSYAVGTGGKVRQEDETDNSEFYCRQSHDNAILSENYYQKTKQAGDDAIKALNGAMDNINQDVPKFLINFEDGKIYHTPGRFVFLVNKNTGNLDWGLRL